MTDKPKRTKEQYIEAVRAWCAQNNLLEPQTEVMVRIATFVSTKKIAGELDCTVYRVQKTAREIREHLGWSNHLDIMRMGLYLALALSESPNLQADAEYLYGDYVKKEDATA